MKENCNAYVGRGYNDEEVVTVGRWMLMDFALAIPFVGFIYYLVLLLGSGNKNQVNYIRARFIWSIIATVIAIGMIIVIVFASVQTPECINQLFESFEEFMNSIFNR